MEDDHNLVELLRWHFERENFVVNVTPDGEEALALAKRDPPDLVVLDWMIEGISGLEVCRRLRRTAGTANVPIIMLSGRAGEEDRIRGLETGADDYLTKPFSPRELLARTAAVLRRTRPARTGEQLRYSDLEMDLATHRVRRAGKLVPLGPTEYRLLRHLMEHPHRVFPRDRLLSAVWGRNAEIELRTVDVHIRRLRRALNGGERASTGKPRRELIRTIRGSGYSLDDEGS